MSMQQTAWLFTKEQESVRLELHSGPDGVQLRIEGPGEAMSNYDFPPGTAVNSFRGEYEKRLLADGYHLQAMSERRVDEKRRASGGDRRRKRSAS